MHDFRLGKKNAPLTRLAAVLSLLPISLLVSLPFLDAHHRNPIPSFFAEWWAIFFGLLGALCLLAPRCRQQFALPHIALLPAGLLVLLLIQLPLHPGANSNSALIAALYLLWAILLMGLTKVLQAIHGREQLSAALASGLLVGALASAVIVFVQWRGIHLAGWINLSTGERQYGNLNQPNHLALQLWLGIAALSYLIARQKTHWHWAGLAMAALVFASLLSGSRALWLYASGFLAISLLCRRRGESLATGATLAFLLTCLGKLSMPLFAGQPGPVGWISPSSDGARGGVWWMAAQMGLEHPFSGVGWGAFSAASYARIEEFRATAPASLILLPAEHAHNIALHLFAELGILAPLLLLLVGAWCWRASRAPANLATAFALALLLMLGLHAQLEYTLWYSFFLGIAAIALAIGDPRRLPSPALSGGLVGTVLVASFAVLFMLRSDYSRLEKAMYWQFAHADSRPDAWETAVKELIELRKHSPFVGYVDLAIIGAMPVDRTVLPEKLALCAQGIAFSPASYAVFKCAALEALAGEKMIAAKRMRQALVAYPHLASEFAAAWTPLAANYPELRALVDLAAAAAQRPATTPNSKLPAVAN